MLVELHAAGLALESSSLVLERGRVNGCDAGARVTLELRYLPDDTPAQGGLTRATPRA